MFIKEPQYDTWLSVTGYNGFGHSDFLCRDERVSEFLELLPTSMRLAFPVSIVGKKDKGFYSDDDFIPEGAPYREDRGGVAIIFRGPYTLSPLYVPKAFFAGRHYHLFRLVFNTAYNPYRVFSLKTPYRVIIRRDKYHRPELTFVSKGVLRKILKLYPEFKWKF